MLLDGWNTFFFFLQLLISWLVCSGIEQQHSVLYGILVLKLLIFKQFKKEKKHTHTHPTTTWTFKSNYKWTWNYDAKASHSFYTHNIVAHHFTSTILSLCKLFAASLLFTRLLYLLWHRILLQQFGVCCMCAHIEWNVVYCALRKFRRPSSPSWKRCKGWRQMVPQKYDVFFLCTSKLQAASLWSERIPLRTKRMKKKKLSVK